MVVRMAEARAYVLPPGVDAVGLKSRVLNSEAGCVVQVARRSAAANELVVRMIAEQTMRSRMSGQLLARTAEMDFLLRLAGTSQIKSAIKSIGAVKGQSGLIFVLGTKSQLERLEKRNLKGLQRLPSREASKADLGKVERGALLNVGKG